MEGGKSWLRIEILGRGSYSTVSLAKSKTTRKTSTKPNTAKRRRTSHEFPALMAVKSAEISDSATLQKEKQILEELKQCPNIIHCYGEEFTDEKNGDMVYNLLLEYASGGTLAKAIQNSKEGGLPEYQIRRYTRSMLRGLMYIHENGYVHLDIKPQNILLVPRFNKMRKRKRGVEFNAKIADFGFAKRLGRGWRGWRDNDCLIGTPQYMSPEAITHCKQEPAVDIWALGCVVAEMVTGKPVSSRDIGEDIEDFLDRIGSGLELPKIPSGMSKEGQDFLKRCFVKNSEFRWTAEMLLYHPFVAVHDFEIEEEEEVEMIATPSIEDTVITVTSSQSRTNIRKFESKQADMHISSDNSGQDIL